MIVQAGQHIGEQVHSRCIGPVDVLDEKNERARLCDFSEECGELALESLLRSRWCGRTGTRIEWCNLPSPRGCVPVERNLQHAAGIILEEILDCIENRQISFGSRE